MPLSLSVPTSLEYFASLVQSDDHFPLLEAAASLAQDEYPEFDTQQLLGDVDQLLARIQRRLPADAPALQRLRTLNQFFFVDLGFGGNVNNYYDPENSYLNAVLRTRRGIPISLAVLWMELAQGLGLHARGVAFPGHFMVKVLLPKGQVVLEFDPSGKLLRTMGKVGVAGNGPDLFTEPNAVLIAPDGSIFVAEGHTRDYKGHPRIIKFDANGKFIKQWGSAGAKPGQFGMPHCLAMDSKGNLYVGDRDNNRIQVFTQDGKLLGILTQFGRPSGIAIDRNDVIYVTDSESKNKDGYGHNPGWKRGIRIGSLKDGVVTDFIPDTFKDPEGSGTSGGEGIWADGKGAVYSAQVEQKAVVKYVKR